LGKKQADSKRDWNLFRPLFVKARRIIERKHYRLRLDWMNDDRQRHELLGEIGADPIADRRGRRGRMLRSRFVSFHTHPPPPGFFDLDMKRCYATRGA
jgi:hypothetical protein